MELRKLIRTIINESFTEDMSYSPGKLIDETLANVDNDVNFLYDTYFKKDIDIIQKTGILTTDMFQKNETSTSVLKEDESKEADKINRCLITINLNNVNYYNPFDQIMNISINKNALDFVIFESFGDLKKAAIMLKSNKIITEFTEEKIKGSIHHELSHWIDDTMHNQHIKKRLKKARESGTKDKKNEPMNSSKIEIQAQIHNIKQLYNKYQNIWDTIS
jgi:regulator of replication initiation timing